MHGKKKLAVTSLILLVAICSFLFGFWVRSSQATEDDGMLKNLKTVVEAYNFILYNYVDTVDGADLTEAAIKGMVESLGDKHSYYLNQEDFVHMQEKNSGYFCGLGIVIGLKDDQLTVISPIDDTPAAKAGIKAGDMILRIDNTRTNNMSLDKAASMMRGKEGTKVTVTIYHPNTKKTEALTITRAKIKTQSVSSKMLENGVAYIRISNFAMETGKEFHQALKKMQNEGMKGLILDLRNNPGGLVKAAIEVNEQLLEEGPSVHVKYKNGEQSTVMADGKTNFSKMPLIVLVNGGSASASEIVSGAIKDSKRGTLVGEKTFGKGSMQSVYPLSNGSGIAVTTNKYLTPAGTSIHGVGIKPDTEVIWDWSKTTEDVQLQKAEELMKEKLSGETEEKQPEEKASEKE